MIEQERRGNTRVGFLTHRRAKPRLQASLFDGSISFRKKGLEMKAA